MRDFSYDELEASIPYDRVRNGQKDPLVQIAASKNGVIFEIPTGEGKTGIGLAPLIALQKRGEGPLFYITPTKGQAEQVAREAGKRSLPIFGRSEYECLYYTNRGVPGVTAQASPCYMLKCGHRVDQTTGETEDPTLAPCPYFKAKYDVRKLSEAGGGIIVATMAFFLTNRLLVSQWQSLEPALTVVDEIHRFAATARGIFEYSMTDKTLAHAVKILSKLDKTQSNILKEFRVAFMRIAKKRTPKSPSLLKEEEVEKLMEILQRMNANEINAKIRDAVRDGDIDPIAEREMLKVLENTSRNIPRFITSFRYALTDGEQRPLKYVVAFYYRHDDPEVLPPRRKSRYHLTVKSYYVAPIIKKVVGKNVIAYSATVGDPHMIRNETGIDLPFHSYASNFAVANTRVFLPSDNFNLAAAARGAKDLNKTLRAIIRAAKRFGEQGHRSLVVVISEQERQKFLEFSGEMGLDVVSYQANGKTARQAAAEFRDGKGMVLVGTAAQYGEGIDLPKKTAPVIFFLRPGYQRPDDPETQFEERRFSQGHCWRLWNWRVMIQALQVRGRNIRAAKDLGVCFFMSAQFRRFLNGALPAWLKPAYRGTLSLDAAVEDTLKLLS